MSSTGTCKFFNMGRGYGFVTENESQTDYFVHTSDLNGNPLQEGDKVQFDIGEGNDGRPKAVNVSGGTGEKQQRGQGGYGGNQGGYGGNQGGNQGGYGGNQGGYGGNQGGNQGGYGGNQGGYGGNQGGQKNPCHNWRDSGECRFGDRCRFSHDAQM